jgi:uncharacterized Zn finger protein
MRKKRPDDLEQAIEYALEPGRFVDWRASSNFTGSLDEVRDAIDALVRDGRAARAAELHELFIAACCEKADEVDDSDGEFGMFVEGLFCSWLRARHAAASDRLETARMLWSWMRKDNYGFCSHLERDAVQAFDKEGLAAFERVLVEDLPKPKDESYIARRVVQVLKSVYAQQRAVDRYVALCEKYGGIRPSDCESLARMLLALGRHEEALSWVDRAEKVGRVQSDDAAWGLGDLRRELLQKLGRSGEALQSAWKEYVDFPSKYRYETLMKHAPEVERDAWREKALAVAAKGALNDFIGICIQAREWDRLARRVSEAKPEALADISHYTTEPAAEGLAKSHPYPAARLYRAMAERILNAGKSKYYGAALGNLENAAACYARAGRGSEWAALVDDLRAKHRRKAWFIGEFNKLVAGKRKPPPTILDRARARLGRMSGAASEEE